MNRPRLFVLIVVAGLFAWMFADALFGSGVFVFRDAGHYYYPLFQFVKSEWLAGRVPLWNPYENLGVPLAGNATSSVFYPGTLIFLLPLDYAWALKIYVMAHVLLAAYAAYRLARRWDAGVAAAGVAAMSYAFSGNVLFQYCNVIFLVGAAWLPLAVLAADRMLRQGQGARGQGPGDRITRGLSRFSRSENGTVPFWNAMGLGAVLAMITLGGNAEMAYHAGLLAAMYAVWLWWHEGRTVGRLVTSRPALLAAAALAGLALSAVQVVPSIEFARLSDRAVSSVPRTVYEVPGHLARSRGETSSLRTSSPQAHGLQPVGLAAEPIREVALLPPSHWSDGLTCRRLEPGTHHRHAYHFSVGPWRLAEYVWPNFSGRQFPVHRRWLEVIPAEGRLWVPSLYMGLVPLVLALAAMRLWSDRRITSPRKGTVPFSLRENRDSPQVIFQSPLGRATARQTWLTWTVILAVVASFGWYGLGWIVQEVRVATGADTSSPGPVGAPVGGLYWLATALLPGYIYFRYPAKLLVIAALGLSLLAAVGWDRAFSGPAVRLRRGLLWLAGCSLLGAAVALAVRPFWHGWLAGVGPDVLFGPLDTAGANSDLVAAFLQTGLACGVFWWLLGRAAGGARWPQAAAVVLVAVDLAAANGWMVVCAPADHWQKPPLLAEIIQKDSAVQEETTPDSSSLYRVYRQGIWMPPSWQSDSSPTRLTDAARWDRDTLWPKYNLAPEIALSEVQGTMMPYDYQLLLREERGRSSSSTSRYVILRGEDRLANGRQIDLEEYGAGHLEDVSLWENPRHLPRAWIETNEGTRLFSFEDCLITHYDPLRVEIEAKLAEPGMVVLCDQFYPGWTLTVETAGQGTRNVPIERANRVMRGARLEAGTHRLIYRFRPASFILGAIVSSATWIGLGVMLLIFGKRRLREFLARLSPRVATRGLGRKC